MLLNFDAEYAKGTHCLESQDNLAHKNISNGMKFFKTMLFNLIHLTEVFQKLKKWARRGLNPRQQG